MNPFMIPTSVYQGRKVFAQPFYAGFHSNDWWPNDGLVSTYSQMYPRIGTTVLAEPGVTSRASFRAGIWYHEVLDDIDHIDIVALPQLNQVGMQKRFYVDLFKRLAAL